MPPAFQAEPDAGLPPASVAPTGLVDLRAKSGIEGVTLAFVLSEGGCKATTDIQQHQGDVDGFRAAGGKVKASFGGANGTYLENACPDADSLAQAIEDFVAATGISDLDFDVEQAGALSDAINQKRAKALKLAQDKAGIKVAFTLACTPRDPQNNPGGLSVASFAKQKHLGLVAFWAINRDQPGSGSPALYSGVNGSAFDFHQALEIVAP